MENSTYVTGHENGCIEEPFWLIKAPPEGGPFLGLYRFRGLVPVLVLVPVKIQQFRFSPAQIQHCIIMLLAPYRVRMPTHLDIVQHTLTLRNANEHCAIHLDIAQHGKNYF